jgi:hypothetical protein
MERLLQEEIKSIREEMRVLKPTMEDSALVFSESAEVPLLVSDAGREMGSRDKASLENKAANIEGLRSSFRICKQQGTFLWPNMSMSPKGVVQQTNSSLVPTPPSVYSSNKNTPNGHNPGSPLKPLAERRAVNISTLSNIVTPQSQIDSISVGKTRDINLNEFPDAYKNRDTNAISETLTIKQQNVTTNADDLFLCSI